MVLNKCALGLRNRLFHRVKLLGDIRTRAFGLDHDNDAGQMAIGTFQPLYDVGVTCMWGVFCHR